MTETARVVEVLEGGGVLVEVTRHEACGTCAARGACHPGGVKTGRVRALCAVECSVGDTVEISISDSAVRFAILWAYVVPVVLLLAGLFLVWYVLEGTPLESRRDLLAAVGGIVGAGAGVVVMWVVNRRIRRPGTVANRRFAIEVVRVCD